MRELFVAGLQLQLTRGDNVERLLEEVRTAKRRFAHLDMVVLPELASFGPGIERARALPDATERRFCALARELRVWLCPGSLYERRRGRIFNTAPVIDPRGRVVARYRKMFPWAPHERGVASGEDFVVVDMPRIGRVGFSICYDGWFPEVSRMLAWKGAEVIIHPTLTSTIDRDVELAIARTNAAVNQCYFLDINAAGAIGNGRSIVCGPGGEVIHQAGSGHELIPVRLDLDYVRDCRARGWQALGQPLKSFRDSRVSFPCYGPRRNSRALARLGALRVSGAARRRKR
jgi:deaminated glutathione amidase